MDWLRQFYYFPYMSKKYNKMKDPKNLPENTEYFGQGQ